MIVVILAAVIIIVKDKDQTNDVLVRTGGKGELDDSYEWPDFQVDLLTPNDYSRPGLAISKIDGIVVHYTANPGATAKQNRDYFEGLSVSHLTKASSHFIVGLDGEAIQCIPLTEISYASNQRNYDTISIETCHPDQTGKFTKKTYDKLVEMCAWLCLRYHLDADDIIRHYDVTGKNCPKYFVEDEDAWEQFKKDVSKKMQHYPLINETTKEH